MASPVYFGTAQGSQILVYTGMTNLGTPLQPFLWTWDIMPAGETGTAYVRGILCSLITQNGATLTVTPILDDVVQPSQVFQQIGTGDYPVVVQLAQRAKRIAVQFQITNYGGAVELCNMKLAMDPIRAFP